MPAADPAAPRLVRVAGREAWHIRHEGRRHSAGTASRAEAEQVLAEYAASLARPGASDSPVGDVLGRYLADRWRSAYPAAKVPPACSADRFLAARRAHAAPRVERVAWAHKPLEKHLGSRPARGVGAEQTREYTAARLAEGVSEGTIRTELSALRAALRWALAADAPKIVLPPASAPRERWLTPAEVGRVLAACSRAHVKLFVLTALHTAARSGAILSLTWDRVDLENRLIDFRDPGRAATRKRRARTPINDALLPALVAARTAAQTGHVIEFSGSPVGSVKHAIRDTAARAGVPGVTPHVFRHTAATWMAQRGVSLWDIAGMLGHSDTKMVADTYGHHSPEHLRDAAAALSGRGR